MLPTLFFAMLLLLRLHGQETTWTDPRNYTAASGSRAAACRAEVALSHNPRIDCWIIAKGKWDGDTEMKQAKVRVAQVMQSRIVSSGNSSSDLLVYFHAFVIPGEEHGVRIVSEILASLRESGLLAAAAGVYTVAMGDVAAIRNVLGSHDSLRKVQLLDQLHDLYHFFEFPTLALMQQHARLLHPDSKILYLHTKGVTRPKDALRSYQRSFMLHYCVTLYAQSVQLLDAGWYSSGIFFLASRSHNHYAGNFFWQKAGVAASNVDIMDLVWHWRFGAEKWPLYHVPMCRIQRNNINTSAMWRRYVSSERNSWREDQGFQVSIEVPTCTASAGPEVLVNFEDWVE